MAMNDLDPSGPPDGAACWTLPPEFVRLRYFFGQRLGVVDLTDEQSYVVGKHVFHNLRAHGAGVLCGLKAERYVFPAGAPASTPTTLLKIRRGAAIDARGRDVVVGWDQCIDVAAWFRKNVQAHPELTEWLDPAFPAADRRLWVCLRYRECPSDPAPAPRDPCGCDASGCEFGRVREGFELSLLTRSEVARFTRPLLPTLPGLRPEETLGSMEAAVGAALTQALAGECPEPSADGCLCLASFLVVLDTTQQQVTNLGTPDNTLAERLSLAPTALLQQLLLQLTSAAAQEGSLGEGPRLDALSFQGTAADAGQLAITVRLASDGAGASPLIPDAETHVRFALHRFKDDGTWEDVTPNDTQLTYLATPTPHFLIMWSSGLAEGRYRLTLGSRSWAQPLVDMRMRPLLPRQYVRHFRLVTDSGTGALALAGALYDS
jgi:hypothetical protein